MKVRYSTALKAIVKAEGISNVEISQAIEVIEQAAAGKPRPLHLNQLIEGVRDTNLIWYRLKPKGATYRIVFSLQRKQDMLTVEGIFRRDNATYLRIKQLFMATSDRNQPDL